MATKAKTKAKDDAADDLLETKAKKSKKPAPPVKKAKAKAAKAEAEEEAPAKKSKGKAKAKAKGNGEAKSRGRGSDRPLVAAEDVKKALLKVKKPISYSDFADANEFNLRQVRRTARRLRDADELVITHNGTEGMVSRAV